MSNKLRTRALLTNITTNLEKIAHNIHQRDLEPYDQFIQMGCDKPEQLLEAVKDHKPQNIWIDERDPTQKEAVYCEWGEIDNTDPYGPIRMVISTYVDVEEPADDDLLIRFKQVPTIQNMKK